MKKQPIHPIDYDRELGKLICEGLTPTQAATCLKYLRRDKRAPLRFMGETDQWQQLPLPEPPR